MGQASSRPETAPSSSSLDIPAQQQHLSPHRTRGSRLDSLHYRVRSNEPDGRRGSSLRPATALTRQISSTSITAIETLNSSPSTESGPSLDTSFGPHITNISASPMPQHSGRSRLDSALNYLQLRLAGGQRHSGRMPRPAGVLTSTLPPHPFELRRTESETRPGLARQLQGDPVLNTNVNNSSARTGNPNPLPISTLTVDGSTAQQGHQNETDPRLAGSYDVRGSLSTFGAQPSIVNDQAENSRDVHVSGPASNPSNAVVGDRLRPFNRHRRSGRGSSFMRRLDMRDVLPSSSTARRHASLSVPQDEEVSLAQLMNATAIAIATQISQNQDGFGSNGNDPNPNTFDALFQLINPALQNLVQTNDDRNIDRPTRTSANSFHILRPLSRASGASRRRASGQDPQPADDRVRSTHHHSTSQPNEGPSNITVVVVAIRSANTENSSPASDRADSQAARGSVATLPPLSELSSPVPDSLRNTPSSPLIGRSRLSQVSRATYRVAPRHLDWLRNRTTRQPHVSRTPNLEATRDDFPNATRQSPLGLEDSPPGPVPPPSTPAERTISAPSSEPTTPSRRQSIASTLHSLRASDASGSHDALRTQEPGLSAAERNVRATRQRRRSESDAARHQFLGSGSARRNGVVEPDNVDDGGGRSSRNWLIYVIGTSTTGEQRTWTSPGALSDNPSYEELLMLSSLLGPVKPPVASSADVAGAGGVFHIEVLDDAVITGQDQEGPNQLTFSRSEQCWICLDCYRLGESVRQLKNCSHIFHQGCIDEWLTTGRNSCPLCREEGVRECKIAAGSRSIDTYDQGSTG